MKQFRRRLIAASAALIASFGLASAQFNPKLDNPSNVSPRTDSLNAPTIVPDSMVNYKIYNDAYDNYLRMLQRRHRNKFSAKTGLTVTQTTFTNWAQGGDNTSSGRTYATLEHKYTAPKFNVKTEFDAAVGLMSTNDKVRKTEDYFNLSSSPSWRLSPRWELSASLILRSQFAHTFAYADDGSKTLSSTLFAPAYLTLAPGLKYTNKKQTIEVFFAPSSGNLIMVLDEGLAAAGKFGDAGKRYIPQFINYTKFQYKEKIFKEKLSLNLKVESFWEYQHKTPKIISENKIDYQITKFFSANLYVMSIFDDKAITPKPGKHWQVTETFGMGINYVFSSKDHPAPPESPKKRKGVFGLWN